MSIHWIANNVRHINATATPMMMRDCGDVESMLFINGKYVISIIMQQRKEISILLPVYNRVCVGMVARLKELCDDVEGLRYEIIAADDGSDDRDAVAKNKAICRMEGCRYVVRDTNSGAAATRNFLTGISRYRWLLFVDCDMSVPDDWFIHRYLEAPEAGVVSGGMRTGGKAADARRSLRCAYARRAQERHTAAERRRHPYQAFRSVNFMAKRSVMESCPFDERMRRYEDVMFGRRLEENGVTVSDEEVEKAWKDACKSAGGAKAFKKTLKTYGYTEDTYKDSLKESLAQQKLKDAVAPTSKPKDSEIVDYINENLSSYNDARRSSNILIKVDSDASDEDKAAAKAKAQECLDKINSGELIFEDADKQYSDDPASNEKKGAEGSDTLTTFVDSYQTALEGLNKGDVSEVVESTYGYHIIKCTDYFHVDNQVDDINQVPKDIKKYVSNVVKTQAASTAYSEWLEQYKKDADITVNHMPKDVPYNVSLKGVTKSSTDESSTTE